MASLRARVIASVLVLAAAGLVALAAVTYAEQSSFLLGRIDQEVRGAAPALSHALDNAGYRPSPGGGSATEAGAQGIGAPPRSAGGNYLKGGPDSPGGPGAALPGSAPMLPPGTYGQRRTAAGKVLGHVQFTYEQNAPAAPRIPSQLTVGKLFTVGSVGSSDLRYRVEAVHDPADGAITVVAVPLREVDQTLDRLLVVEALVIVGVLIALGLSAYFVVRLGLRPLDRMEITAGQIAAGELSHRVSPASSRTEVGRLGLALNAMLDRLEQAFAAQRASEERLRTFLADASHELRTPLASIRGYAELFRMGATQDRAGTELAMRRIEEESKRMGVLVEDLLTLARLDETPQLKRTQLDLAMLAQDAVEDARATAPDRAIELRGASPAPLCGDPHQLRQVLGNLMRNALVHTPAGSAIELALEQDRHTVTLSVRDHGPGLPADGAQSLFERFWRSETGRERGKAGAGLGLSIAHGVVAAHRGQISAANAPGGGAVFTVRLPKSLPPAAEQPYTRPPHASARAAGQPGLCDGERADRR
jgi:two-component system OmpR family sensor kinase